MNIRINTEDLEINIDGTIVFYIPTGNDKELNNSYNPINFIRKSSECTDFLRVDDILTLQIIRDKFEYYPKESKQLMIFLLLLLLARRDYVGEK